jgi:hypothetical protein
VIGKAACQENSLRPCRQGEERNGADKGEPDWAAALFEEYTKRKMRCRRYLRYGKPGATHDGEADAPPSGYCRCLPQIPTAVKQCSYSPRKRSRSSSGTVRFP